MSSLSNKRIILGITGGIAAYKCAELTRLLIKSGATVQVVMTKSATEFITPLTMQALSGNRVSVDLLDPEAEASMGHIELARWADLILIAPATADFISRLANSRADDLLTTLVLASTAPIAIAPAMNQAMWSNQGTQTNVQSLLQSGHTLIGPSEGDQACGDVGRGRLTEPEDIVESCESFFTPGLLSGKRILITGGPTREAIDPVRFISNHSSGKMAYALANEAVAAGAQVTLISGPVNLSTPERVTKVDVITANEMRNACLQHYKDCDVFIGVAAVADYRPADVNDEKIKKTEDELQIRLIKNPDIISEIASQDDRPFVVGFAAETTDVIEYGRDKLKRKNLDLLFANHATDTFNSDSVTATAIHNDGERNLGSGNKNHMARQMLKMISEQLVQSKD